MKIIPPKFAAPSANWATDAAVNARLDGQQSIEAIVAGARTLLRERSDASMEDIAAVTSTAPSPPAGSPPPPSASGTAPPNKSRLAS